MKKALIRKSKYAIIKAKQPIEGAFANIDDGKEITVIIDQRYIKNVKKQKSQKDFRLITFDMILPFSMTGFIAKIATSLAQTKIPIFVISSYSTDHILIKSKYLNKAKKQLKDLGFIIKTE